MVWFDIRGKLRRSPALLCHVYSLETFSTQVRDEVSSNGNGFVILGDSTRSFVHALREDAIHTFGRDQVGS